jgi:thiosulfate reductase cytochrome b subunit
MNLPDTRQAEGERWTQRHSPAVRVFHWVNVAAFLGLLVTGFAIFVTYPELYWGNVGYRGHEPALRLEDLGIGNPWAWADEPRRWGRNYHFTFSWIFAVNGVAYLFWAAWRGHLRARLLPSRRELAPRHILADFREHLRFRALQGTAALSYNTLQKLAYLVVIFVVGPLIVLTGLGQSPAITAAAPWLLDLFGGRQSIRSVHMICTMLLVSFLLVHVFQVFVAGFVNEMRSMTTGRFVIPKEKGR